MSAWRILSLDGGGIKGVFSVAFLAGLEDSLGDRVGRYFDLIAGTSTGGIIALGLGLGFSATELLSFYETLGRQVFAGSRLFRALRHVGVCKYGSERLRKVLESKFGDRKLGDSQTRLIIPSLNLETGKVHVFKTAHDSRFEKDWKVPVVEVALAAAAAPTYFPAHIDQTGLPLVDGGVWANNPVGIAVVEAIGVLRWDRADLRVLSVGCPRAPIDVGIGRRIGMGRLYWATRIVDVLMAGQSSGSLGTAKLLAGADSVCRVEPSVPAGRYGLDAVKEIASLKGLGFSEAREKLPRLKQVFFGEPGAEFTPSVPGKA